jgi:uncharacterized protein (DUF3084 family)
MALDITREELREDILTIATAVVEKAIRENNHVLIRMINEDLAATNDRIDSLSRRMNKRFKEADHRFEQVDQHFNQIDQRFEQIDQRFEQIDQRFEQLDEKIDFTHKLLHVHVANPSAHSRRS